jgi:hypothetical protein
MTKTKTVTTGQMLDEQLASLQSQITGLRTDFDAHVADGETPIEPPEPPVDPEEPDGEMVPRPIGLDYIVPGYDRPEVPVNALEWSVESFATIGEAIAEARLLGVALHVDVPGEYDIDPSNKLPKGIFGVEGVIFNFTSSISSGTPCGFYLVDQDCQIVGIEFRAFGTVVGMSTRSRSVERGYEQPWDIHGSRRSAYGTLRCVDKGTVVSGSTMGVGVPLDYTVYPESLETVGPALWISDCVFRNCELPYFAWSDMIGIGRIDFHRNVLRGTGGGFAPEGSWWTEVCAVNNDWADCEVPSGLKASRYSTFANLGTNATLDVDVAKQVVHVVNNEARNITCLVASDGTNAAVFLDARQVTPTDIFHPDDPFTWSCSAQCSFNKIVRVLGIRGQEDSNALYGKTRSMLIERNEIEDCGSHWYSDSADGAEATGTEFKQTGNMDGKPAGAALVFRGNIFRDMPPKDKNRKMQSVQGTNDIGLRLWIIGNEYIRCHITQTEGNVPAVVRHYGNAPEIRIMCNTYRDCDVDSPAALIGLHSLSGSPGPNSEISNNTAYSGDHESYTGARELIKSSSSMSGAKVGLNQLIGPDGTAYPMTANFGSSDGVVERSYQPPLVSVDAV